MEEFTTIRALRSHLAKERAAGRTVALVATMGYLHAGHLRLVNAARQSSDVVVLSVFVNPLQFGPNEDFTRYPRDLERDRELASGRGADILFAPPAEEMYPVESDLRISAGAIGSRLEGVTRPGHFDGVLTVVAKLFNIVSPDVTCFGQKDIQQVTLVRRMIRELEFPVRLVVVPTEREADGLAMSSRNVYLSATERASALALSRALRAADAAWRSGVADAAGLHQALHQVLDSEAGVAMDYVAIVDPEGLQPVDHAEPGVIVALAARVGKTRMIDNLILGQPG